MSEAVFEDLRSFIDASKAIDTWHEVRDADWKHEIGALSELSAELPEPPMLIFDRIKGYPEGYRVASLVLASTKRAALALGLPLDQPKLELIRLAANKIKDVKPIPPAEVPDGPVMENKMVGEDVDLSRFPAPHFHAKDGGRYLGTGDIVIMREPESGYLNMGTYRMQVHERNLLGLWISPGKNGRLIRQRYWDQGKSCPVVAAFGEDPVTFSAANQYIPWGRSELEFAGGFRGKPVQVIRGPVTGLPIPAHAEIAIEGEIPPPAEQARDEGPFGEWPGYYSGGTIGTGEPQPVIRVKAVYHRKNPIIMDEAPLWPFAKKSGIPVTAGILWDKLEKAGIQDIVGVWTYSSFLKVVSIRQRYAGHARQAGLATCALQPYLGRYVVIVDEDIDPTDIKEVLWAMQTRVDPITDIETLGGCWAGPLDPRMSPEKRAARDFTSSQAIFYAVRPFHWREKFPKVSRAERELRRQVMEKYQHILSSLNP